MKNTILLSIIISFFLLLSCDCHRKVKGIVIDFYTKKPIDSVFIVILDKNIEDYTDENGEFTMRDVSGGLFGCPPMPLVFKKQGYDSVFKEIKYIDTIQMKLTLPNR